MTRISDVATFNPKAHRRTVERMRERHEKVHDAGKKVLEKTGKLHPNVDIFGKRRVSHNAMVREGDHCVLPNGIALPIVNLMDGTGSTAQYVEAFFFAAEHQYTLMGGVRKRYNTQFASGVVQDVYNVLHDGLPVVQLSQFESDEGSAEQVRLLQPASMGNDTKAEDYDLGLAEAFYTDLDILRYGLNGYLTLTADEIGRGYVTDSGVREYLGQDLERSPLGTVDICRRLLDTWHLFLLQVPTYDGTMLPNTTYWWRERMGLGRVIKVPEPRLLAEVRAGIVYVSENLQPTETGLVEFLRVEGESRTAPSASDIQVVWRWLQDAEPHFGAQARLPGYNDIPKPGDVFAHYRHAWPIGHPRAGENVTPSEDGETQQPTSSPPQPKPTDWSKF